MKNLSIFLILIATFCLAGLTSCSNSPTDKAHQAVQEYLLSSLKNPKTYESLSFSKLDTLDRTDTSDMNIKYELTHSYNVVNSDEDKIKMTITFYLDQELKVSKTSTNSINGNYGILTGNVYWKYNDYVGNRPDAGAKIILYTLDTIRGDVKFETTADIQGNYEITNIPPGQYFLLVRSENATDCPDIHLRNFKIHAQQIKQLFKFDISQYNDKIKEIFTLDSLAYAAMAPDSGEYTTSEALGNYSKYKDQSREQANELFKLFPDSFTQKIRLYTGYSNSYDLGVISIEENQPVSHVTDFGVTCI